MLLALLLACASPADTRKAGADTGEDSAADSAESGESGETADSGETGESAETGESGETADTGETGDSDAPWTLPERPDVDHPTDADSWRWGGGVGYPDVVDPGWPVVTRVGTREELAAALAVATSGDIVYVDDAAEIDLTGAPVCVPGGVWLAGGRGVGGSPGALLYTTAGASTAMVQACGDDVRVTGLRLRGPDADTCPPEWPDRCPNDVSGDSNCAYCTDTAYGVSAIGFDGLEVDNNELSGWTYAATGVKDGVGADIHHNHIHHGWREGLGYGLVLYGTAPTTAIFRWNRLDAMRHVVAGQGYPDTDYEARDNLMGEHAISHVYDMHGEDEAAGDGEPWAGGDIRVHRNIVLVEDQYSFVVRGRPATGAWLYDNCLAPSSGNAADQRYYTGNFWTDVAPDGSSAPNTYGASASECGTLRWCLADAVVGPLRYGSASGTAATDLLVGDLDGDGRDDVFGTDGTRWRWANPDGGTWTSLASSGVALSSLRLADLDGDGIDDVFYATGSAWQWSRSGSSSWATLRSSTVGVADVRFGDFDGDGAMDVFTSEGGRWWYYPRGSGSAVGLASSGTSIDDLAVADFDGDGIADVFTADGTQWRWSRSGSSSWADLATSSETLATLALADVDGDHVTDVLDLSRYTLRVSYGGRTGWTTLRHQQEAVGDVRFGDFDGDGRADVLVGGCL